MLDVRLESAHRVAVSSPSWRNRSPGDLTIELPAVTATSTEPVIAAASRAARDWARTPLAERIQAVYSAQQRLIPIREELARGIALETGKPITEAMGELNAVIAKFDLTIADAEEFLPEREVSGGPHPASIRRFARGPAAVLGPFNFPLHLANGALLAHLLAGNPVIFKPSPQAAVVAQRYAEIMTPAFPPGVFQCVQGWAEEGQAICMDPRVRAVCFTGSVPVGRALALALASDFSKELALELGGRNAAIICADADLGMAANAVADGICLTCGQRCNATSRILVDDRIAAAFEDELLNAIGRFAPGDPLNPATTLGPLINESAVRRYETMLDEDGEWLLRGRSIGEAGGKKGYYVTPAVRGGAGKQNEESFVPIANFETFSTMEEAIALHNASTFGLTASVFTRSESVFQTLAGELVAGNIYANLATTFSPSTLPFGGWGESGNGHPGGRGFIRFTAIEQALQIAKDTLAQP